jgi:hypothetical protein
MALESLPAYSSFDCGTLGLAYNEVAFRHFLTIEQRRAERARRTLLLLLVNSKMGRLSRPPLEPRTSGQIFKVLGDCVREVDFVGWYREGKVAGAVVGLGTGAPADVQHRLKVRISKALTAQLPTDQLTQLRVRVVPLGWRASH